MSRPWLLVTPASRGLGFALARHLLRHSRLPLVATARRDLDDTRRRLLDGVDGDPARLRVLKLDATDDDSIAAAAKECHSAFPTRDAHLRLGFVLPGMLRAEKAPDKVDATAARDTFLINALGPLLIAKHFVPFLPRRAAEFASDHGNEDEGDGQDAVVAPDHATLALMSARVGSITDNRAGGWYSYRASKAAVTQLAKSLDIYLAARGGAKAMCVALHPGTVRTDLSRGYRNEAARGVLDPEDSAARLVDVVRGLGSGEGEGRGRCWDWEGKEVPP